MAVWGKGVTIGALSTEEIRSLCAEGLSSLPLEGKRVLVLIPDYTRHAPLDLFFKDRASLTSIGTISPAEFHDRSGGYLREEVDITIHKLVLEYDHIVIVSPIVPHETAGFFGGNKYFFPDSSWYNCFTGSERLSLIPKSMVLGAVRCAQSSNAPRCSVTSRGGTSDIKHLPPHVRTGFE